MQYPAPLNADFLGPDATSATLLWAVTTNHVSWMTYESQANGGEVRHLNGIPWIYTPGPTSEVILPFPQFSKAAMDGVIDTLVDFCREHRHQRLSCWTKTKSYPRHLGAKLAARGFEWGWQPRWMGLPLDTLSDDTALPAGFRVTVNEVANWTATELPYYDREAALRLEAHIATHPDRTWHFGVWDAERVVGHVILHVTTGPLGVAGIYAMGVAPDRRMQGIGRIAMEAACRYARALGCHHALLNAAAPEFYDRLGWIPLGWGQTWWMHAHTLAAPPPSPQEVAFAEAIGKGDIATLDSLAERLELPTDLDAPLAGGATPMRLAISARKPSAATWLVEHGATLDILAAWDLGWKERAQDLLRQHPALVNRRTGAWQTTPLHEAASRGDAALARLLLSYGHPDLEIRDSQFNGTPSGWAAHLKRTEIAALIEEYRQRVQAG
jgi:predicted N-acetyltransferase YhbS